jgi:hypothetical protein
LMGICMLANIVLIVSGRQCRRPQNFSQAAV